MRTTVDTVLQGLVIVPFAVVPVALVLWTIYQVFVRGAWIVATLGLLGGAGLCFFAFLWFFAQTYCESCADRPVSPQEARAIFVYFGFGLVMLVAMWLTARWRKSPKQPGPE